MNTLTTCLLALLLFSSSICSARLAEPAIALAGVMEARAADQPAKAKFFLPLRKTDIRVEMSGAVAETTVTQRFKNDTPDALEAVYLFPLPSSATITEMEVLVGERVIRSRVMERGMAKGVYELAKGAGVKTALLEQERPNLFTTSVANFLPGETVQVRFSYVHVANFFDGKYMLSFPMTHGPRFVPLDAGVADAERLKAPRLKPTVDAGHRVSFEMLVDGLPINRVTSRNHRVYLEAVEGKVGEFKIGLREEMKRADADLDLDIYVAEGAVPKLSLVSSKGIKNHALLSIFPPTVEGEVVAKRDIVFVIDTSGSMKGNPILRARAGLEECLSMLGGDDAFTIVRFSNGFDSFTPGLVNATPDILEAARSYVGKFMAGGGTRMQPALRHVLEMDMREDALGLVVFLTDGDVGDEDGLRRLINEELGDVRLFTLGIGSAPNEFLMRMMAQDGRGQARFIRSDADIGEEISSLFGTLGKPVLTDIELRWKNEIGLELDGISCFPKRCPDVFHQRPLQVFAELPAAFERGSVEIVGKMAGEEFHHECAIDLAKGGMMNAGVRTLFARAEIDDLMQQRLFAKDGKVRGEIEESITQLGIHYELVTKFTSRVAVDDRGSRLPTAPLKSKRIAVPMPRGAKPSTLGDPRLRFPKPMFVSTPVAVRLPNLERPGAPRLDLKAPPEAVLISLGKPVTGSDDLPIIGDLDMITDGDLDGGDGSYVELGPGLQWVQIDLGKSHELFAVRLWHFHKNARAYLDVIVQISDDPTFKTGVTTIYNNDHDNSSGLGLGRGTDKAWIETNHGRIIDVPGKKARYVRLYSRGNTSNEMNHYVEVEVFGKP